jgi:NitT/TauT family transport system substrate-binding protein
MFKGAKWVAANKTAAAKLSVEKGYLASTAELNVQAIRDLKYMPAVTKARQDILQVAKEMKAADFLSPDTDPEELVKKAWLDLDGVTDEWIESVEVERIAGGGDPPKMDPDTLAALLAKEKCCCRYGCCGDLEFVMQLTGDWELVKPVFWQPVQPEGGIKLVQPDR